MPLLIQCGRKHLQRIFRSWLSTQTSASSCNTASRPIHCDQYHFASQLRFPGRPVYGTRSIHKSSTRYACEGLEARESKVPKTHYELFPKSLPAGPPPNGPFVIDLKALRNEFIQLQAKAHPDRHPQGMKNRAEATSARINEAYKTLQNPLKRAQYLLSLRGLDIAGDETAKLDDPKLLMEVLETREEIEATQEVEVLVGLKKVNEERIRASEAIIDKAFKEDNMDIAKEEAVRLRYWVNIEESLQDWEKGKPIVLNH